MLTTLRDEIRHFVLNWPDNHLASGEHYFDEPLVGVASGNDPLFLKLQRVIGPFHWTPCEALAAAGFVAGKNPISVVSWVLPIGQSVRGSNRLQTVYPSLEWALTRTHGEALNSALRKHVVAWLKEHGITSTAPQLTEGWIQLDDPTTGIASSWSERHVAYIAGLGTFSLNDGLITERGIAHRLGSVVAVADFPPTHRSKGLRDNCLYHAKGSCGICIQRCPADALSFNGHDKKRCREHVYGTIPREAGRLYGVTQTGCGLCQTAVPCESINPCRSKSRE